MSWQEERSLQRSRPEGGKEWRYEQGRAGSLAVTQRRRHEERKGMQEEDDKEEVTEPWRWA